MKHDDVDDAFPASDRTEMKMKHEMQLLVFAHKERVTKNKMASLLQQKNHTIQRGNLLRGLVTKTTDH